jgi:uncharacterized protein YdiU (UPF0061 family)
MLDPKFDPLEILQTVSKNQMILDQNIKTLFQENLHLRQELEEQRELINTLLASMQALNTANEQLMRELLNNIKEPKYGQTIGNH